MEWIVDDPMMLEYEARMRQRRERRMAISVEERRWMRNRHRKRLWETKYSDLISGCFGGKTSEEYMEEELDSLFGEDSR